MNDGNQTCKTATSKMVYVPNDNNTTNRFFKSTSINESIIISQFKIANIKDKILSNNIPIIYKFFKKKCQ